MPISRRSLLAVLGRTTRTVLGGTLASKLLGEAHAGVDSRRTLRAYLDTLLPGDKAGPGALELGVLEQVEAAAARNHQYHRLLEGGCGWLDDQAGVFGAHDFDALDETERSRIVLLASEQVPGSLPRVFFETTRTHAFRVYWAKPEAWSGIGYDGPPQPDGFLDYAEPPAKL